MTKNANERTIQSYNSNPQFSIKETIRQTGEYLVQAKAWFKGNDEIYYSNEVSFSCLYPSVDSIKNLPLVRNAMENAWTQTLNAADETGVQEYGGVVILHTQPGKDGEYTVIPQVGEKTPYNRDTAEVKLNWEETNIDDFRNGGSYCVMIYHAHPPLWYCPDEKKKRVPGPSILDRQEHTTIPAIVYDFDNQLVPIYTPLTPKNLCVKKEYVYGPSRRIR